MNPVRYKTVEVSGIRIFYREARNAGAPKLLLLHGFPSASQCSANCFPSSPKNLT